MSSSLQAVVPAPPDDLASRVEGLGPELESMVAETLPDYYFIGRDQPYKKRITKVLGSLDDGGRRAVVALVLLRWLDGPARPGPWSFRSMPEWTLAALRRRRLAWTPDELVWLTRFLVVNHAGLGESVSITAQIVADGLDRCPDAAEQIADDARALADLLVADQRAPSHSFGYRDLNTLIARFSAWAEQGNADGLPEHLLRDDDSFGPRARTALSTAVNASAAIEMLELCTASGTTPKPSPRWRATVAERVAGRGEVVQAAQILASTIVGQPEPTLDEHGWAYRWISRASETLVRGALWIARDSLAGGEAVRLLGEIGSYCAQSSRAPGLGVRSQVVTNAAIAALADGATDGETPSLPVAETSAALLAIRQKAATRTITSVVDQAIASIAAHHQIEPETLAEAVVPTYGLNHDGRLERPVGAYTAVVKVDMGRLGAEVTLRWRNSTGRELAGTPATLRKTFPSAVDDLRRTARDLRRTYPVQRDRIDQLMTTRRRWTVDAWRQHYLEHPLIGILACSLIWTAVAPGMSIDELVGLPVRLTDGWHLVDAHGSAHPVPTDASVGLWHPLGQPLEEVMAWRRAVTDRELHQPFKQAFREIYLLTEAEEQTYTHSNRFAAHILRYRQMTALMRARNWRPPQLGGWDVQTGEAIRSFPGLRCVFYLEPVDDFQDEPESAELCSSDHVRFEVPDDTGEWNRVPLADVDPLVFSESMRDVDLFVGVTSIAADPEWSTDGRRPHQDYWSEASFGALSENATTRREALRQLLPRTRLASISRIDGRYLIVEGRMRNYKIHIGSGNILMEPDDRYLCIVPKSAGPRSDIYLPFEGDGRLSLIISKAFLLADDDKITDPTIMSQIAPSSGY